MPDGIKTKGVKTGSYANSTAPQLQGKSKSKSQQDVEEMSANYANVGAAVRNVMPVGNQSYQDFQRTRKSPAGQKAKSDYETANKLPRLTDADYQGKIYKQGLDTLSKTASDNPGTSVFTDSARTAAYGDTNKTSMEMGNQVSGSNGSVVDKTSLASRSKRMGTGSAYTAPGMGMQSQYKNGTKSMNMKDMYAKGSKGIKTKKMTMEKFEDSPEDKKADVAAMAKMNKSSKYADGTKGIKTKGGMFNFINGESDKVKNMSDADLKKSLDRNMNYTSTEANAMESNLLDETVSRKYKKQGGYAMGTKGIKTKKMC